MDTIDCVLSIEETCRNNDNYNYKIVIVENGSTDDSAKHLRQASTNFVLLETGENLGFAGGNNVGIRYALQHGADYIMLLNNDTIVRDATLIDTLVRVAQSDPLIGFVSPSIYYHHAPEQVWYAGASLSLWRGWKHNYHVPQGIESVETGYASGCCMLVRTALIREIGELAESYFLSVEDVEWSLRARRAGWKIVYAPNAALLHKGSVSSRDRTSGGMYSPIRVYYEHRNMIWLIRQYGNPVQRWIVWPVRFSILWGYKISAYILLRRWPKLLALLCAIRDGLFSLPAPVNTYKT